MNKKGELVEIYSRAFLLLCLQQKLNLAKCLKVTDKLIAFFTANNECFWQWIKKLNYSDLKSIIIAAFQNNIDSYYFNLFLILTEDNKFDICLDVLFKLQERLLKQLNIKIAKVYSVVVLKKPQLNKIAAALAKRIATPVRLFPYLDWELIGGIRIEVNNQVFDNSLQKQLRELKYLLLSSNKEVTM